MPLDPGFLALLSQTIQVHPFTGEDQFGNNTYSAAFAAKAFVGDISYAPGGEEQEQQETTEVARAEAITDAIGIKIRDRLTLPGGSIMYVSSVTTAKDEQGVDLYQTVQAESTQRG